MWIGLLAVDWQTVGLIVGPIVAAATLVLGVYKLTFEELRQRGEDAERWYQRAMECRERLDRERTGRL